MLVERNASALAGGLVRIRAEVVKGFQRGSKLLGFPTANMAIRWDKENDRENLQECEKDVLNFMTTTEPGIYYGFAQVRSEDPEIDKTVQKAAVSIGWNPTFNDVFLIATFLLRRHSRDVYCHIRFLVPHCSPFSSPHLGWSIM